MSAAIHGFQLKEIRRQIDLFGAAERRGSMMVRNFIIGGKADNDPLASVLLAILMRRPKEACRIAKRLKGLSSFDIEDLIKYCDEKNYRWPVASKSESCRLSVVVS